jgi:lysophospholipase L1-like esterase
MTTIPVVAHIGDSITAGSGNSGEWVDDDGVLIYQVGFGDQADSKALASCINLGRYGEVIPTSPFTAFAMAFREARAADAGTIVIEYGVNNVRGGQTYTSTMTDWTAYVVHVLARFPTARVIVCTLTPETTDTGSDWNDAAGQTPVATEAVRVQVNNAIRAHALLASEDRLTLLDTADGVEVNSAGVVTRNGGRWDTANGAPTGDGLHPLAVGGELMADQMIRQGYHSLIRHTGAVAAPAQVTGLSASGGSAQATLGWNTPDAGGKAITTYAVRYRIVGAGSWTAFSYTDVRCIPAATITGLDPDTQYEFQVAGVNSVGTGTYSASATATTDAASVGFLDEFTDADGTLLTAHVAVDGTTWHLDASGTTGPEDGVISGNRLRGSAVFGRPLASWIVCASEVNGSAYDFTSDPSSNAITLYAINGTSGYSSIGSGSVAWSVGTSHTVTIEVRDTGITVKEGVTTLISSNDTSATRPGKVGFQLGSGDASNGVHFDSITASDV